MFSSDKHVETVAQLIEAVKDYLSQRAEYARLDLAERAVRLLKAIALYALLLFIAIIVAIFVSMALVTWLSHHVGFVTAFLLMAAFHALVLFVVWTFRKPWIERPLVRRLAPLLLE